MLPYFWYLLKVIICSGILFGYYWLFLRNKLFHQYNRFYLLASLAISIVLPLFKIDFWSGNTEANQAIWVLQAVSSGDEYLDDIVVTTSQTNWSFEQLYTMLYLLICVVFLFTMIRTLFLIRSLLKKYPVQEIEGVSFVNTDNDKTPFSFFKYIFWNNHIDIATTTGRQIFKHEVVHIQEKHTLDKLFVNSCLIFCWCNPFFWLYRRELNMIHEFIADKKAVDDSDTASFAAMILQATYPKHRFELANNFFYSPIKRRLLMLTKNNNPRVNYIGRIMVLPLLVLVFAAFTFKAKKITLKNNITVITDKPANTIDTIPAGTFVNVKYSDTNYIKSDEFKNRALVIVDSKEIGNVGYNYIDQGDEKYSTVTIYNQSEAKKIYGIKGKYGVIKLTQKEAMFFSAKSIYFDDETQSLKLIGPDINLREDFSDALINLEGKIITAAELRSIDPKRISSISILKGNKLNDITDAKGKNAVIYISLKADDLPEVVVTTSAQKDTIPMAPPPPPPPPPARFDPAIQTADSKKEVELLTSFKGLLYIGILNHVYVATRNIKVEDISIKISPYGSFTGSNGDYKVQVSSMGNTTISVYNKKTAELIKSFQFEIKRIPDPDDPDFPAGLQVKIPIEPKIFVGKFRGGRISTDELKAQKEIRVTKGYSFTSADIWFSYPESKTVTSVKLTSSSLSSIQEYVNRCVHGSTIMFDNVYLQDNAGNKTRVMMPPGFSVYDDKQLKSEMKNVDAAITKAIVDERRKQQTDDNKIFTRTEIEPKFAGGDEAWRKYLVANLKANTAADEGWKAGTYTVMVKFIVRADGAISDVTTENYTGSKTALHCMEVIKNAPKWLPAIQNGKKVNAYKMQPISFAVTK